MIEQDKKPIWAFPCSVYDGLQAGMELRDWFAGMALTGILYMVSADKHDLKPVGPQGLSKEAYAIADAMLAARRKS